MERDRGRGEGKGMRKRGGGEYYGKLKREKEGEIGG
jgi:hypothetical protein